MSNLKDELVAAYNKVVDKKDSFLQDFKNGVADALLIGKMADKRPHGYKQGYDFGLVMYQRLFEEYEK